MTKCIYCGGHVKRVHRGYFERWFASDAYVCHRCKRRSHRYHHWWFSTYRFIFSRYSVCLRCGTYRVRRLAKRDRVDSLSKHPLSLIQQMFVAPRNKCPNCRLQFHDLRPLAPEVREPADSGGSVGAD